jgi:IS605 OrfB family transposase
MRLTVKIKLVPSAEEHSALLRTLELCNKTANELSEYAHETGTKRKFDLHYAKYETAKGTGLAAQAAVRTIAKVGDAYSTQTGLIKKGALKGKRLAKAVSKPISFKETAAQAFDKNNLSYNFEKKTVSIWTVAGRLRTVPFECSPEQLERLKSCQKGETDLSLDNGVFYLTAGAEIKEQPIKTVTDYLAFDSGIVNIATTSDGDNWSGGAVTLRRKKNRALRAKLQSKGTKSAKRLLKKRSKKESRFVADSNHVISKKIVELAEHTGRGIAHENLSGIRERARSSKPLRTELNSWAFAQLFAFVAYKAKLKGIPVKIVDPAYTSQLCPECGTIGKTNRPNRDRFCCSSCSHTGPADVIAARNIRTFALTT